MLGGDFFDNVVIRTSTSKYPPGCIQFAEPASTSTTSPTVVPTLAPYSPYDDPSGGDPASSPNSTTSPSTIPRQKYLYNDELAGHGDGDITSLEREFEKTSHVCSKAVSAEQESSVETSHLTKAIRDCVAQQDTETPCKTL